MGLQKQDFNKGMEPEYLVRERAMRGDRDAQCEMAGRMFKEGKFEEAQDFTYMALEQAFKQKDQEFVKKLQADCVEKALVGFYDHERAGLEFGDPDWQIEEGRKLCCNGQYKKGEHYLKMAIAQGHEKAAGNWLAMKILCDPDLDVKELCAKIAAAEKAKKEKAAAEAAMADAAVEVAVAADSVGN